MKIKYYTAEYLRDNHKFFEIRDSQEKLFWKQYDEFMEKWWNAKTELKRI